MRSIILTLAAVLLNAVVLNAQAGLRGNAQGTNGQRANASSTPRLRGRVLDSSGAVMQGSSVTVSQGSKVVAAVLANERGEFDVELPAGEYQLAVTAPDFKPFKQNVRVTANTALLSVSMALETVATVLDVTDADQALNVDTAASLSSQTITGDQLQDLPDNEDDLAQYLQDLASAAGAAGAQATFVIDGFNGGRLPPRDQIQKVIIENNSFSAEGNGGARIQIITRPGTGRWTGQFGGNFNDSSFNAANPTALNKPARSQKTFNLTSGGPIIPNILTMTFTGQNNETEAEGNLIRAILPSGTISNSVISPTTGRNLGARGQLYLSGTNTLNFNLTYGMNKSLNQGIGGFTLPERASNLSGHNWQVQLIEKAFPNTAVINEFRFQANETDSTTTPVTNAISVNVAGAFNSGGSQNSNQSKDRRYELNNTLRWTVNPKWQIQSGIELDYERRHSVVQNNFLGTYTFASLADYLNARPQTFTKTAGNPLLDSSQLEVSAFIQADWHVTQKMNIGLGARYVAQTNLHDYNNLAPTASVAIQASKRTVIRAGGRFSYQDFSLSNVETVLRNDGTRQSTLNIAFPTYNAAGIPPEAANIPTTDENARSIYVRAANLQAPDNITTQLSVDRSFGGSSDVTNSTWRVTNSLEIVRGEHLVRIRNINAPFPGAPLPADLFARLNSFDAATKVGARAEVDQMRPFYPFIGNMSQYESAGSSLAKNWTVILNTPNNILHIGKIGYGGRASYTYGLSQDNGGTAPDQYDWSTEWARSQNDQRHRFQTTLNVRFPNSATLSFNVSAASGRPYNITTGADLNGDQSTTDRPAGVSRNSGTAPGTYNINSTFTKIFFLKKEDAPRPPGAGVSGQGGQRTGTQTPSGPQVQLSVQAANLLNNTQVRGISGVETSSLFREPIGFASGRRVTVGFSMRF